MEEGILITIKKMLGIPEDDTAFDEDILVNINSCFMALHQIGVGPEEVFSVEVEDEDDETTWSDFMDEPATYSAVKTYIYLKVKLAFDPPATSFVLESIFRQLGEWEWRLMTQVPIEEETIPEEEE
jgi:hypothetical protein